MAAIISSIEGELADSVEALVGTGEDFLGLPFQDDAVLIECLNTAWAQIEARIPQRFIARPFEVVIRADYENELVTLPFHPVVITDAVRFTPADGTYGANEAPFVPGPTPGSVVLPVPAIWRITGTAGPLVPQPLPPAIITAVRRLVSASFTNRGDVPGEVDLVWSGALEPLKPFLRV